MLSVLNKSITDVNVDIIVNASNGVGFMGGFIGKIIRLPGVAEAIHYETKGVIEREAKSMAKRYKLVPRILAPYKTGETFVTTGGHLSEIGIIHAVTVKYPGFRSNIKTIEELLPKIIKISKEMKAKSIALPLLGCGNGGLRTDDVLKLYYDYFSDVDDLEIYVCIPKKE